MASAHVVAFQLAGSGFAEALGGTSFGFHFWHRFCLSTRWLYWFCGFSLQKSEESRGLLRGSLALFLGKLG